MNWLLVTEGAVGNDGIDCKGRFGSLGRTRVFIFFEGTVDTRRWDG